MAGKGVWPQTNDGRPQAKTCPLVGMVNPRPRRAGLRALLEMGRTRDDAWPDAFLPNHRPAPYQEADDVSSPVGAGLWAPEQSPARIHRRRRPVADPRRRPARLYAGLADEN